MVAKKQKSKFKNLALKGPLLMVLCTLFLASSQFLMKLASKNIAFSFEGIFLNWAFISALAMAGFGAVLMTFAFKHGDMSSLFPLIALSFIWTTIIAAQVFEELIGSFVYTGIILIIIGVVVLGGDA
ncbi:hypothetical protein GOV10_05855 [Candidatus Woesearchaeota archaeon]|nr:hypothetical protein [Candidatus Woesearchaeota archaeon]